MISATGGTDERTRVGVSATDPLAAAGIALLIGRHPEFVVLPQYRDAEADVMVVATNTATADLLETLRLLAGRGSARVVAITADRQFVNLLAATELGLASVIPRSEVTAATLRHAILVVRDGGVHLPPDLQAALVADLMRVKTQILQPRGLNAHGLDNREVNVVRLLAEGYGFREIAEKLNYSERTVKNILHALTARLGLRNRTQAVAHAMRVGAI